MHVEVSTDNHVDGREELFAQVRATVEDTLGRFAERLTRVEVHVGDENSHKGGAADKRCAMEARPAGHQPLAVTHTAATIDEAIDGAADKLEKVLDRTFGKLSDHKGRTPMGGPPGE